jgi:hypothetical protein
MRLPNIQIDWDYFKELDEIHFDDLTPFNILLLTFVKDDEVKLVAYDTEEKQWAILREQ